MRGLIKKLLLPKPNLTIPTSACDIPAYCGAFENAIKFTRSCGIEVKDCTWLSTDVIDTDGDCIKEIIEFANVKSMDGAAGQCLKWSHFLEDAFRTKLRCEAWVTLGQIWKGDKPIYNPTWKDFERWAKMGLQQSDFAERTGYNLHAWITLQTGELVDPTYFTTLASALDAYKLVHGAVTWGRDPTAISGHRYFPMAVGSKFARAIAEKSMLPLLAETVEELQTRPMMLFFE